MQRVTLLFVAALFVSSGCNQQQRDVEGEIFIVLQNRETIRLSLTDVAVISPETGKSFFLNSVMTREIDKTASDSRNL